MEIKSKERFIELLWLYSNTNLYYSVCIVNLFEPRDVHTHLPFG